VTRSEIEAGVCPAKTCPKLIVGRSSAIETSGWTSTSTPAEPEVPPLVVPEQVAAGDAPFLGVGAVAAKSATFEPVSVHPPLWRTAASVLLSAGAGPLPS